MMLVVSDKLPTFNSVAQINVMASKEWQVNLTASYVCSSAMYEN